MRVLLLDESTIVLEAAVDSLSALGVDATGATSPCAAFAFASALVLVDPPLSSQVARLVTAVRPLGRREGLAALRGRVCAELGLPRPAPPAMPRRELVERFMAVGADRVHNAIARFAADGIADPCALVLELQHLDAEATMTSQHEIAHLARAAEVHVARWSALASKEARLAAARCLDALGWAFARAGREKSSSP
jgi:hypothetical protein